MSFCKIPKYRIYKINANSIMALGKMPFWGDTTAEIFIGSNASWENALG
jgi:hypothetical protein